MGASPIRTYPDDQPLLPILHREGPIYQLAEI
jgi:hypothetical protein